MKIKEKTPIPARIVKSLSLKDGMAIEGIVEKGEVRILKNLLKRPGRCALIPEEPDFFGIPHSKFLSGFLTQKKTPSP